MAFLLEPYLGKVVVIGGLAYELYDLHPEVGPVAAYAMTTRDLDLAAPDDLRMVNGVPLAAPFFEAGFSEIHKGRAHPTSELRPPENWGAGYGVEVSHEEAKGPRLLFLSGRKVQRP